MAVASQFSFLSYVCWMSWYMQLTHKFPDCIMHWYIIFLTAVSNYLHDNLTYIVILSGYKVNATGKTELRHWKSAYLQHDGSRIRATYFFKKKSPMPMKCDKCLTPCSCVSELYDSFPHWRALQKETWSIWKLVLFLISGIGEYH